MSLFIQDAFADVGAAAEPSASQGLMSILPMILLLVVFMYLMVIRPQSKRSKEHKNLIDNLQKGDEVVTISGILGKIEEIKDDLIILNIAENTNITIQKNAISSIMPRGTIKSGNK